MSSTEFNVGLLDSGRSSSRVLKPPGGGHSDIFGIHEEEKPKSKSKNQNSEIKNCFNFEDSTKKDADKELKRQDNGDKPDEDTENALPEKKQEAKPQRVRVPPGGFSSGLW